MTDQQALVRGEAQRTRNRRYQKVVTKDGVLLGRVFRDFLDGSLWVAQPNIRNWHGGKLLLGVSSSDVLVDAVGVHTYITLAKTAKEYGIDPSAAIQPSGHLCHYPVRKAVGAEA